MKKITFLFSLLVGILVFSQVKTKADKMIEETQLIQQSDENFKLVWWIPTNYWQVAMEQNATVKQEQLDYIMNLLDQYTIIVVGDYTLSSSGETVNFKANNISDKVLFYGLNEEKKTPLKHSEIDDKVLVIIDDILKPLFVQMLGKTGTGLTFFVYDNKESTRIDPTKPGSIKVVVNKNSFKWQLPLVSLMAEKTCSTDQQRYPGNFVYCPIHGHKL